MKLPTRHAATPVILLTLLAAGIAAGCGNAASDTSASTGSTAGSGQADASGGAQAAALNVTYYYLPG